MSIVRHIEPVNSATGFLSDNRNKKSPSAEVVKNSASG